MPKTSFSWLHLTDFHYGLKGQDCLWPTLRGPFLESLADLHERCGPWDAVLFTGDFVQSGKSEQFREMQSEVLDPLWETLREIGSGQAVLLAVPGNHDLYRINPLEDNPAIDTLLERGGFHRIEEKFWDQPTGAYRRAIRDAFAAYDQWWEKAPRRAASVKAGILPGDFSATLECGGRKIGIVGLNTTFLQLAGGNYERRLVWDARQVHAVCDGAVDKWLKQHDVCLLLTHHGPSWLTLDAQKQGDSEIAPAGRFAAHLFGHQHETRITYIRNGGSSNPTRLCQGCSVFGMEKHGERPKFKRIHGYTAGRIIFGERKAELRLWPRIATNKAGPWRFIPDDGNADLKGDGGTSPESISFRSRSAKKASRVITQNEPLSSAPSMSAPHSTLPARRPFFGRTDDLEKISKYLLPQDRSWGVVLDGPGGMGKTALALEAAHRAPVEHFPLKLWFTAKVRELFPSGEQVLRDHRGESFYDLLNELARSLGRDDIPKAVPDDRPQLVRHALAGFRALLVLDNLETLATEQRRRVFELLDSLPAACRAIVTIRRYANASTAAHTHRLDKLERGAADELLAELGKGWMPVSRLTQVERDRLYSETGGNPLLLTWVAGQLGRTIGRCRTVAEAIERLQKAQEQNDPLHYIFGDLVETLTADETAVLAALVHFTQPTGIEWLLPLAQLSPKAAETALDGLRDRALLIEDDQATTWLLPPLAAGFLRRTRPEAVRISGQLLAEQAFNLAVANGYKVYSRFPNLEASWPQIAAALPVIIRGDNDRLQTICDALYRFLDFSGRWDDRLSLSAAAEARAVLSGDFRYAGRRAYDAGFGHFQRGQAAEVLKCADRADSHWNAAHAGAHEQALAIFLRGQGLKLGGNCNAAIGAFREALDLWRSLGPKTFVVACGLNILAEALRESRQLDEAETLYREALAIARGLNDPESLATYTGNLAELALDREQWPEAEKLSLKALRLAEEIGRRGLVADDCWRLAKALAQQGRGAEGRCYAERAVNILTALRSPELANAQAALAECLSETER